MIKTNLLNIEHWTTQIDQTTDLFKKTFDNLTVEQLNWKPNPRTWSIAQNIHHLIAINQSYYPVIAAIRQDAYKIPWFGKMAFMVNFLGKTVLNSVQPDRRKKMKTFAIWEPSVEMIAENILKIFEQHQLNLKQLIEDSQDLLERGTVITSPANKNIVYKLETAFDIIVTHEKRHFEQAKEVLDLQRKNAAEALE